MTTGLPLEWGDVRGVVDGLAAGDAPLACISARRAFDRELDPDDEELDRLGVGMLDAGLEDRVGAGAGRERLRDALDGGAADGVLGRRVCAECSICRSADELLLRDGVLGRADEGAGRLGD